MDHESAYELYQTLRAYDAGAKAKQGLGFVNDVVERVNSHAERWRNDATAVQSSAAHVASDSRGEHRRQQAERHDAGATQEMSGSSHHRPQRVSSDGGAGNSRGYSEHGRSNDNRRGGDRWLMDDERLADQHSSRSGRQPPDTERHAQQQSFRDDGGSQDATRGRDRDHQHGQTGQRTERHRARSVDRGRGRDRDRQREKDRGRDRDSSRHRDRDRDRSRSRYSERERGRDAHGSRDARPDSRSRARRSRSRSREPARQLDRSNGEGRPGAGYSDSRHAPSAARDQHKGHPSQRRPLPDQWQSAGPQPQAKPAAPDWHEVIDGYDQMTQAMRLRARMRYHLQKATTKALDDGQQWTRFEFDSNQPPDGDEAGDLDAKELPSKAAQMDASHEAAIFGAPPVRTVSGSGDDEDLPQVVELHESGAVDDVLPTVVEEAAAPTRPILSWRDRAAQLKAQREAQAE